MEALERVSVYKTRRYLDYMKFMLRLNQGTTDKLYKHHSEMKTETNYVGVNAYKRVIWVEN
jgi:hypothetical protein